jgi:hypothetical protein
MDGGVVMVSFLIGKRVKHRYRCVPSETGIVVAIAFDSQETQFHLLVQHEGGELSSWEASGVTVEVTP